jgi:MoaA/NifB/PqqE/SkfB family radical SAM enzyme
MKQQPTVIWELTRACELKCRHCPHAADRSRNARELSTFEAYGLVNQVVKLAPKRFVLSGGDPLARGDVYQLVDHAQRRGLRPAVTIPPTRNASVDAIARLRRNGLSRIIVSLEGDCAESHDAACGMAGAYSRTLHIVGMALCSGIDVEVNTLVTEENLATLDGISQRIEKLGVVAWNLYLSVPSVGLDVAAVMSFVERLRQRSLLEIRVMDAAVSTVFISSEGYVRNGELVTTNMGDLRRRSLAAICEAH